MLRCINCKKKSSELILDLGSQPLANSYIQKKNIYKNEVFIPLQLIICKSCGLLQSPSIVKPDSIFSNYAYFSSFSSSWVSHAKNFTNSIIKKLKLTKKSKVMEVASNDGYLLQFFKKAGIPCFGIEPAKNIAKISKRKGIKTYVNFFSKEFVRKNFKNKKIDLLIANNVLAHTPFLNDFVSAIDDVLHQNGTCTIEFPHFKKLFEYLQFDTIYHEHYSYFTLTVIDKIFRKNKLKIFDVDIIDTHGGSLRVFGCKENREVKVSNKVKQIITEEENSGILDLKTLKFFAEKVLKIKYVTIDFLIKSKKKKLKVFGYGAAAKGNTFLNFCGIKQDLVSGIFDINPEKNNKFMPGSKIPIFAKEDILKFKPDIIIILPWNLKNEIIKDLKFTKDWNAKFVTFIPNLNIF